MQLTGRRGAGPFQIRVHWSSLHTGASFQAGRKQLSVTNTHNIRTTPPSVNLSTVAAAGNQPRLHSQGRCHGAPGELISDWCSFPAALGTPFANDSGATSPGEEIFKLGGRQRASVGGRSRGPENYLSPNSNLSWDFGHLVLQMNTYAKQMKLLKCF